MSQRNSRENKKRRRTAKAIQRMAVRPAYIDLIEYVKVRTRCSTGTAEKVLLAGALKVDSHPVGYKWRDNPLTGKAEKVLERYIPAEHRMNIVVTNPFKNKNE